MADFPEIQDAAEWFDQMSKALAANQKAFTDDTKRVNESTLAANKHVAAFKQMNEGLQKATFLFAAGTASISGFVRAASPVAFDTLGGSIQLLAGAIGQAFVPVIIQVSDALQQAADWVQSLNSDTVEGVAQWVAYGVAVAGAAAALNTTITIVSALTKAIGFLRAAALALSATPLGIVLLAAGAAVLGGIALYNKLSGGGDKGKLSEAQRKSLEEDKEIKAIRESGSSAMSQKSALQRLEAQRAEEAGRPGAGAQEKSALQRATDALAHFEEVRGKRRMATAIPKEMNAGFSAIEQARRNFQTAGLGMSPLEREQLELQRKNNMYAMEIARNTRPGQGLSR